MRVIGHVDVLTRVRPALVVANHAAPMDPVLLADALGLDALIVVTRDAMRVPAVARALRGREVLQADLSDAMTLRKLVRVVAGGRSVIMFPEGRVTRTGALMKLYEAPAVVAARTGVAVIPLHIEGTGASQRRREARSPRDLRRRPVTVTVGSPQVITLPPALPARERRRQAVAKLTQLMQAVRVEARPRQSLFEAFVAACDRHGRATLIMEDLNQTEFSYATVLKAALALGRLTGRIADRREVVGVLMPNVMPTVAMVLGMNAFGRVPAMLNYSAGPEVLRHSVEIAGIRTVVTSRKFIENARLHRLVRALDGVRLVYVEDLREQLTLADKLWLIGRALPRPRSVMTPLRPDEPAVVLFTSGSEGRPKGVVLSNDGLLANMAQMAAVIDFGIGDKFLNALPMYHTFGLVACTLMPLVYGTRLFLYTNPLHYRVVPEIAYTRDCTYLFGTGTFLGQYARQARPYDFRSVRYVISGGEKLNPDVQRLYRDKFGLRVLEGYGATECGPAIALNVPQRYRETTVGCLLPGVEHRLTPVAGIERGGMLHVRSPHLMLGYLLADAPGTLHPPRSEAGEGWYATGDIVEVDADGFVEVIGRLKRFAKVAGEMVPLELVERVAREAAPGHQHAASVGQAAERGEITVLFTTDAGLDRMRLVQAARVLGVQELAVAKRIEHVDALPVLGTGKTDYVRLTQLARNIGAGAEPAT